MNVKKRDGSLQEFSTDKLIERIKILNGRSKFRMDKIDVVGLVNKVSRGIYDGITSIELDTLLMETAAAMIASMPDYRYLASAIAISNMHHRQNHLKFSEKTEKYYQSGMLNEKYYEYVKNNADYLDGLVDYSRDYEFDYFGTLTLKKGYLLTYNKKVLETPSEMYLRVAITLYMGNKKLLEKTYDDIGRKYIHATPTLFNSGLRRQQLASCFLMGIQDDSIDGIFDTLKQTAKISQSAGGIGISVSNVRAKGSKIKSTGGKSDGLVPMLRVFNDTARYVDQGGGKRKGSFAIYLEPWHADIEDFLELKKNHGKEEMRARDLFYSMWIPDLFMERVQNNEDWTLFSPDEAPNLMNVVGEEFNKLYTQYEKENRGRKVIKAKKLYKQIVTSQIETGMPYMCYKDAANMKSNQQNLGIIKSSNLCTEILEYHDKDEVAVCNLASISLPYFVNNSTVDYDAIEQTSYDLAWNLDNVIDKSYYPVVEASNSNLKHRPVGIGVQGLANVYAKLKIGFDSQEAKEVNIKIFASIYHGAIRGSIDLAKERGTYKTYVGSPASEGKLQFDLWGVEPSDLWDWDKLKLDLKEHGLRNSLLVAPMPTASTSQLLGNNECFEPYTSNLYSRRVNSGEFVVINPHLVEELDDIGLWDEDMKNMIIASMGSVQNIYIIPEDIRIRYKTAWEMSQKVIIDQAADRAPYICQTQSMNLFMDRPKLTGSESPIESKLASMHMYTWKKGLKTGMYYLRSKPATDPIQFTIDKKYKDKLKDMAEKEAAKLACSLENPESCMMCSG